MKRLLVTALALVFAIAACTDSASKTKNFATQADAENAIAENEAYIGYAVELALIAVQQLDFDGDFGSLGFFKNEAGKPSRMYRPLEDTATYNASTGWWTYEEHESEIEEDQTITTDLLLQLRFTEHDPFGFATDLTNKMEYKADVGFLSSGPDGDFGISYSSDLTFTGLAGYHAHTGNAVLNGNTTFNFDISSSPSLSQGSFSFEYVYDIDYNNIAFANEGEYPESGSIDFVLSIDITPNIQGFDEYNVEGTITFDGDNTATLVFGGWNFVINLDTGVITPA